MDSAGDETVTICVSGGQYLSAIKPAPRTGFGNLHQNRLTVSMLCAILCLLKCGYCTKVSLQHMGSSHLFFLFFRILKSLTVKVARREQKKE